MRLGSKRIHSARQSLGDLVGRASAEQAGGTETPTGFDHNRSLLIFTVKVELSPGGNRMRFEATFPDSTHSIR